VWLLILLLALAMCVALVAMAEAALAAAAIPRRGLRWSVVCGLVAGTAAIAGIVLSTAAHSALVAAACTVGYLLVVTLLVRAVYRAPWVKAFVAAASSLIFLAFCAAFAFRLLATTQ